MTTSTANTHIFYSIWRNRLIRDSIRNYVCRDTLIDASIEYLNNNHRYLSQFSYHDKVQYNIIIHCNIKDTDDVIGYVNSKHRDLIDRISIDDGVEVAIDNDDQQQQQQESEMIRYDCNLLHQGLRSLSFYNQYTSVGGKLPESIRELTICSMDTDEISCPLVNMILAELPPQLERLSLPEGLKIDVPTCRLPDTLNDFEFITTHKSFKPFVVPPNKVFKCTIDIQSNQDLQWLAHNTWVHQAMYSIDFDENNPMPSHLTRVELYLIKTLRGDILPSSLTSLSIDDFVSLDGLLRPGLRKLELYNYDNPLKQGHLPDSLTELDLGCYNQPLEPFVLPKNLTRLRMESFNQDFQANTLPRSLSYLELESFKGSFEHVGPLDNICGLTVFSLHKSVATLLQNVKKVEIRTDQIGKNVFLKDTAIQDLVLYNSSDTRYKLYPEFLPSALQKLKIRGFKKFENVLPTSCISLKTDMAKLNTKLIPSSVKITKLKN
ncbi:hypothetical protein CYY_009909 [Polysphondylium violaceum]|uniref:FNIP repeat-containing protein n=1 Tax=Polysphondylium violaceum TaxID=133409 RepID=A0A8J4PKP4_9MYCE|nr:hypothetical protein CYY_009909 [Polysphondylium violaceum]